MTDKAMLKVAFEAGQNSEDSFERWYRWFFRCQDCGQDTNLEPGPVHDCPARLKTPYRSVSR